MDDDDGRIDAMLNGVPVDHMRDGIRRYYLFGISPGSFLRSLLENKLSETFGRADMLNLVNLQYWVKWLQNDFDLNAWGSEDAVRWWIEQGGLKGIQRMIEKSPLASRLEWPTP